MMMAGKHYCVGFLFSQQLDRVLLIEKRKPAWQAGRLNGIGGKVEPGEEPLIAMAREFAEETGCAYMPEIWQHYCRLGYPDGDVVVEFFRAFHTAVLLDARSIEAEQLQRAVPWLLPVHVIPNLRWLIPLALDPGISTPVNVTDCGIEPQATPANPFVMAAGMAHR